MLQKNQQVKNSLQRIHETVSTVELYNTCTEPHNVWHLLHKYTSQQQHGLRDIIVSSTRFKVKLFYEIWREWRVTVIRLHYYWKLKLVTNSVQSLIDGHLESRWNCAISPSIGRGISISHCQATKLNVGYTNNQGSHSLAYEKFPDSSGRPKRFPELFRKRYSRTLSWPSYV